MKVGWKTTPFEDCIEPVTYTTKIQRKDFLSEGTFPIVSQEADLINGRWENDADLFKVERPMVLFGDHTRSFKYVDFDFVLGADGVKILKPKAFLHPRYFYFQLQTAKLESLGYARHYRLLKEHSVSYPDFAEQRRIVTLLDEAFADIATAKANNEKNLQNAREIFESQLQFIFKDEGREWPVMPLEKVASIINGFAFKSGDFTPSGETKCIKITNVGVRKFVCESDGRLPKQFSSKFTSVAIPAGSIVMALTRTIISSGLKVAVVPSDYDNALLNQRVAAILPCKGGVSMSYLFAYLSSQAVAKYVSERVNTLMQPNLSIVDLRSMPIPTPSFSQQEKITELIALLTEETHRLESIYRQKLTALDDLKKSLLHQAFSGQL